MSTKFPELFASLAAPLPREHVRVRKHDGAQYITARTVMNVLDTILGPERWNATYERWGQDAVMCRLSITLPDDTVLTKCDVGSCSSMSDKNKAVDAGDDDKGGVSDSLKRAAVLFGVGRFLYQDGVPEFFDGEIPNAPEPTREPERREDPRDRDWSFESARPASRGNGNGNGHRQEATARPQPDPQSSGGQPRNGRQLYAWAAGEDKKDENLKLVRHLNQWGKGRDLAFKMIEWGDDDVARAFEEAQAHFREVYGAAE